MRLSLSLLFSVTFAASTHAADWWNWRGPWQNGVSPEKNLPAKFGLDPTKPADNLLWRADYGARSTPLIMNGKLYIINAVGQDETQQERVLCLDADTGKLAWEHKFNVWHTDIVTARLGWTNLAGDPKTGNVYAHGTQGLLICLSKDGKLLWERSLTEEYGRVSGYGGRIVSPVVHDDLVILSLNNTSWGDQAKGATRFLALNKDTGAVVWWADPVGQPKDSYHSTPIVAVIDGQKQVIGGCGEGSVVGIEFATGRTLWRYGLGTAMVNCSPVVQGNHVFIAHGEENADNNLLGRAVCLDASQITSGRPKEVWVVDGIRARYASPFVHEDRVYFTDDVGRMHCLDVKTGDKIWAFSYGRNARGSPLWADGKIYVGEVGKTFHILEPGDKACKRLFKMTFRDPAGKADVEINGTPAAANGRVYFATSEGIYCIGTPEGRKQSAKVETPEPKLKASGKAATLQVVPADVVVYPGESAEFKVRGFDEFGSPVDVKGDLEWSLPTPPVPTGAKSGPPALKGDVKDGKLTVDAKMPSQHGYVMVKSGKLVGKARVRVAPKYPYTQDFEKIPDGAVPAGWVNTQGKFLVKTIKGQKVLGKVLDKPSPLLSRANAYIGMPTDENYTIESDVSGERIVTVMKGDDGTEKVIEHSADFGIIANRYVLFVHGSINSLRISSWDALPRVDQTVPFAWKSGEWYRMKLSVDINDGKAIVRGKCWPRDEKEPDAWTIELKDPVANKSGAPGLYAYVTGNLQGNPGTEILFDNVKITPNKK